MTRRRDEALALDDLPPNHRVVSIDAEGRSLTIRQRLFAGDPITGMAPPAVCNYLEQHGLYCDAGRRRSARLKLGEPPRLLIVTDEKNAEARRLADVYIKFSVKENPSCILVIGGDGTMLRAIHDHWRRRVPFFGINAGHLGFLLNKPTDVDNSGFPMAQIVSRHMPLLKIEMQSKDGHWHGGLAFNDAWIERSTGQTAWMTVRIDGNVRIEKLVGDGLLVSIAAGSTAYARSMGVTPLLIDTPAWMIVGSNVLQPINWKSALLSLDSLIEVECLNTDKRPIRGFHESCIENVMAMRARVSRIAAVELAFSMSHDITEKIQNLQFLRRDVQSKSVEL
jgi:NAD kinase